MQRKELSRGAAALLHARGCTETRGRRAQMEGMVNDLQLAREKQMQFDGWKKAGERELAIELSVNVLTTGFWPTYKARPRCPPR